MPALDRRKALMLLLAGGANFAMPAARAKDGGGDNSGPGGGDGNSGPGGGEDGGGDDGGDRQGSNSGSGEGDDSDERSQMREAVRNGRAAPLREVLALVRRRYVGEVVGVRLKARGDNMIYHIKVLGSNGRLITVSVDAVSKRILRGSGP